MDAALEKRQVKRAYKIYAPAYDFVFDWIFHPGREQAIRLLDLRRGDHVLEVGIGTGLNLPLYPGHCRITGIDLSEEMLEKAQDKVVELGLNSVTLNDGALACILIDKKYGDDVMNLFDASTHGRALREAGFGDDLAVCAAVDSHGVLPVYQDRQITRLGSDR